MDNIQYPVIGSSGWGTKINNNFREVSDTIDGINDNIGTETMGTTATTIKGAIAENTTQLEALANDNLLINGDFRINQRGQTSYNKNTKYCVDRWRYYGATDGSAEPINKGIKINVSSSNSCGYIMQYLETDIFNEGDKLTVSYKVESIITDVENYGFHLDIVFIDDNDDEFESIMNTFSKEEVTKDDGLITFTFDYKECKYLAIRIGTHNYNFNVGDSFIIRWAKLELGDKATPFYPRPYGEELALCKRYFRRIKQSESAIGTSMIIGTGKVASIASKQALVLVPGETEMRIAPSVSSNGKLNITFDDKTVVSATVSTALIIGSSISLRLSFASTPSHAHLFAFADLNSLDGKNVGYMDFDSEIY